MAQPRVSTVSQPEQVTVPHNTVTTAAAIPLLPPLLKVKVWVVTVFKGSGHVGGVFTNIEDAQSYVGERPNCGYTLTEHMLNSNIGETMEQRP